MNSFFLSLKQLGMKGISLVQILLLGSAVAGSALLVTRLSLTEKEVQKESQVKFDIDQLHDLIFATLQNREHCTETFSRRASDVGLNAIFLSGGKELFKVYKNSSVTYINGNVAIEAMELAGGLSQKVLKISYKRFRGNQDEQNKTITRRVLLKIQHDPENPDQFLGCYAFQKYNDDDGSMGNENIDRDVCLGLGQMVTWDSTNNVCKIKPNICPSQDSKFFVGLDQNGAVCKDMLEILGGLPTIVDTAMTSCDLRAAKAGLEISGKKVRLRCECDPALTCPNRTSFYTCQTYNGYCGVKCSGLKQPKACPNLANIPCGVEVSTECGSCGKGTKDCPVKCEPTSSCADALAKTCQGVTASDGCNPCGMGTKDCKGCVPDDSCQVARSATCVGTLTNAKDNCGNSCGGGTKDCACVPDATCAMARTSTCTGTPTNAKDNCGNSCGNGLKPCTIVGSKLVRMDNQQVYWTSTVMSSGETLWSGGQFCYISAGPIYEAPTNLQEIWGTKQPCTVDGPK